MTDEEREFMQLFDTLLAIATYPPMLRRTNVVDAKVSWTLIVKLRAQLDEAGIDWRTDGYHAPTTTQVAVQDEDATCISCGRVNPPDGLRLNEEYDWICNNTVACVWEIAATIRDTPSELPIGTYASAERVAEAIDHDYDQRNARKK